MKIASFAVFFSRIAVANIMFSKTIVAALTALVTVTLATNLPFSWDTVPVFAFPGAHDGFLTQSEINNHNLDKFNMLLIWGFNVSCQSPNGTIYPSHTSGSYYTCGDDHEFYANMEASLNEESKQFKEMVDGNPTVLGYIESTNAQQSYIAQNK